MRSSKRTMLDQQRALEPEMLALLCDLHEHAPRLARLLLFIEPTKTSYRCLGRHTHSTQKLTRKLAGGGLAPLETGIRIITQPAGGFSVYFSRVQLLWQVQGGIPHATAPLSD
jgi:hypothetical protein